MKYVFALFALVCLSALVGQASSIAGWQDNGKERPNPLRNPQHIPKPDRVGAINENSYVEASKKLVTNISLPALASQEAQANLVWLDKSLQTVGYQYNQTLYCAGLSSGTQLWSMNLTDFKFPINTVLDRYTPRFGKILLYVGNQHIMGIDISKGTLQYRLSFEGFVNGGSSHNGLYWLQNQSWSFNFRNYFALEPATGKVKKTMDKSFFPKSLQPLMTNVGSPVFIGDDVISVAAGNYLNAFNVHTKKMLYSINASQYGQEWIGDSIWWEGNNAQHMYVYDSLTGKLTGNHSMGDNYIQNYATGRSNSSSESVGVLTSYDNYDNANFRGFNANNISDRIWWNSVDFRDDGYGGTVWTAGNVDKNGHFIAWWQTSYGTNNYYYYACTAAFNWVSGNQVLNFCTTRGASVLSKQAEGSLVGMIACPYHGPFSGNSDDMELLVWDVEQ